MLHNTHTVTSSLHYGIHSPARPSFQPVSRPVSLPLVPSILSNGWPLRGLGPETDQTDRPKDTPDHSTPSLKIAAPTIIQFDRVSLLSARLWLVPPPLATFDMPPLPPTGFPYRPLLIRPCSDLLLFSSLSFFHQRPMSCLAMPRARFRLHEDQKNPHHGHAGVC